MRVEARGRRCGPWVEWRMEKRVVETRATGPTARKLEEPRRAYTSRGT